MARPIAKLKVVVITLANGEKRTIEVKTATERYVQRVIDDMVFPAKVIKWEIVKDAPLFGG